jgi:regulatory protein
VEVFIVLQKLKYPKEQIPGRIKMWCDRQERSQQEVRDKLYSWGLYRNDCENLIVTLIEGNYLNEERFARAYVSGRFRIKRWGRNKILKGLKEKRVSTFCIRLGMAEIDDDEYLQTLEELIDKKLKLISSGSGLEKQQKVGMYLLQRGFESELVWPAVRKISEKC